MSVAKRGGGGGSFTAALLDSEQRAPDQQRAYPPRADDVAATGGRKSRCCDAPCLPRWGDTHMNLLRKNDVKKLITYFRASLALYGAIVVWYGGWTQLDVGFAQMGYHWANGSVPPARCAEAEVPYNPHRDIFYVICGTGVLVLLDALNANAGLPAGVSVWPERARCFANRHLSPHNTSRPRCIALALLGFCRVTIALLASMILWLGWYNTINSDICLTQLLGQEFAWVGFKVQWFVGACLLGCAGTFYTVSGIDVSADLDSSSTQAAVIPTGLLAKLSSFCRANISLFAQTLIWAATYGALETTCWFEPCDGNLWRELFYCVAGESLFPFSH